MMTDQHDDEQEPKMPFGKWIMTQRDRGDWVDGIAEAARGSMCLPTVRNDVGGAAFG